MATIKLTVPGKQIVAVTDWETPGATPVWGPQKPGSTRERHIWPNDTSTDPIGVSPFQQDKKYVVEKRSLEPIMFTAEGKPVYGVSRATVLGSQLVSPGVPPNGPAERNETVLIEQVAMMPAIFEAVEIDVEIPG